MHKIEYVDDKYTAWRIGIDGERGFSPIRRKVLPPGDNSAESSILRVRAPAPV